MEGCKGLVAAEKQVLFEIENFTVTTGLTLLLAAYYVFYVKYPMQVVFCFLFKNTY